MASTKPHTTKVGNVMNPHSGLWQRQRANQPMCETTSFLSLVPNRLAKNLIL